MRIHLLIIFASLLTGCCSVTEWGRVVDAFSGSLAEGLILYLPADGNAYDESDNGHNGELIQAQYGSDRHGKAQSAFSVSKGARIKIPDTDMLDTDETFTLMAWINPERAGYGDEASFIMMKWDSSPGNGGDYVLKLREDGQIRLLVANFDHGYTWHSVKSETNVPMHEWTHVAATFDRGDVKIYMNGRLDKHELTEITYTDRTETRNDDITVGALWSGGYFFDGLIDEVRIYNRCLSDLTVRKAYEL